MPRTSVKQPKKVLRPKQRKVKAAEPSKAEVFDVPKAGKYYEAVGRRKTSIARVRLSDTKNQSFVVNEKPLDSYFQEKDYQRIALESLEKGGSGKMFELSAKVRGGGMHAQAEAIRQGSARALLKFDKTLRPQLKALGFLTRDSRMRERKKFGLKRARRARQWRKR